MAFRNAVSHLPNLELVVWHDAFQMMKELPEHLPTASLISLDHDLMPQKGATADPGSGLDVAGFLVKQKPVCSVIVHTTNFEKGWAMINELSYAKWDVHRAAPAGMGESWVLDSWLPMARRLLGFDREG